MEPAEQQERSGRGARLALAAVSSALGIALLSSLGRTPTSAAAVLIASVGFFGAERMLFRVRVRGTTSFVNISEAVLAIALLTVGTPWTAVALISAITVNNVLTRWPLDRSLLDVSQCLLGVGAASWIIELTGTQTTVFGQLVVATVAVQVFSLANSLAAATSLAIAGDRARDHITSHLISHLLAAFNTVVGVICLELIRLDWRMVLVLAALFSGLVAVYRSHIELLGHHDGMQNLHRITNDLQRVDRSSEVRRQLLEAALDLVGAEIAELVTDPNGSAERTVVSRRTDDRGVGGNASTELAQLVGRGHASIRPQKHRLTGIIGTGGDRVDLLRVATAPGTTFAEGDRWLFELFLNHAGVALDNGQLVEELREQVAQRFHEARHDALTGLPNRLFFDQVLSDEIHRESRSGVVGVVLADLDRFKEVNDTLGHAQGDALLVALAERLMMFEDDAVRVVARLGGDEFAAVVVTDAPDELVAIAHRFRVVLEQPIEVMSLPIDVTASVGVSSLAPDGDPDSTFLLQQADVAMYHTKERHLGVVAYEDAFDPYSPVRLSLAADLRRAVEAGEIEAHYQPKIDLATGECVGVEALARWTHPSLGPIFPDQFIPIAEQSGLIRRMTYDMLGQSLARMVRLRSEGYDLIVAVNLSVRCLADPLLVAEVGRQLEIAGVEPNRLTLEVTESVFMDDPTAAIEVLEKLAALGVKLSLDDFGTGHASFEQLKRIPVDEIKIDKSFVLGMVEDDRDAAIVRSVVDLGRNLGIVTIAEGVETEVVVEALRAMGCHLAQGYHFSRPVNFEDLQRWLRTHRLHEVDGEQMPTSQIPSDPSSLTDTTPSAS